MNAGREVLLWAARNRWLREHLPRYGFMRATVARFMPGERMEDAVEAAERLAAEGIPATFTYLGENVAAETDADAVADHYLRLFNLIEERGIDAEVSVKPTHLGLDLDPETTYRRIRTLAERSASMGRHLFLDMESAPFVEPTLALYRRVHEDVEATGICIQAYLRRTPSDVADLLAANASMRLVKGAYREPREVAIRDRARVRSTFLRIAIEFLRWAGTGRLALATHDVSLLEEIERRASAFGFDRDAYEIQMLYGIRAADQRRLAREGYRVRVLIAYGDHWYPWFMRRMAERPANVWFAIRNVFARR